MEERVWFVTGDSWLQSEKLQLGHQLIDVIKSYDIPDPQCWLLSTEAS